jgi:large subunit ribosomal protein L2
MYRLIDFKRRDRDGIEGKVVGIEYDPNRSCHIALIQYADGVKRYIPLAKRPEDGAKIVTTDEAVEPRSATRCPCASSPPASTSTASSCIPGRGAQMCRSAGTYAKLTNKEGELRDPGAARGRRSVACRSTAGHHRAGRQPRPPNLRARQGRPDAPHGRRPITRGVAKSHHAHPLGGGSGRSQGQPSAVRPDGRSGQGRQHAQPQEALDEAHHPSPRQQALRREEQAHGQAMK